MHAIRNTNLKRLKVKNIAVTTAQVIFTGAALYGIMYWGIVVTLG